MLNERGQVKVVWPADEHQPSYVEELRGGWSADNVRGAVAAAEELERIAAAPTTLIAGMIDREAKGDPVKLPNRTGMGPAFNRALNRP